MTRKILAICVFIMLLSGGMMYMNAKADPETSYNAEQIFELAADSVFYIRVMNEDKVVKSTGTGVIVSPDGIAATAYHVVKGAERIEGVLRDGRIVRPIEVVRYDETADAAVLKLPDPQASSSAAGLGQSDPQTRSSASGSGSYAALPLRDGAVKFGETVFTMGYPLANTPIIATGIVNSPKAEINGRNRILTSSQVASGMSGGPMLDTHGRLAGIISGSLRTMDNIHLVVGADVFRRLLPAK